MQSHTRPLVTNITIPINPHLCLQLFSFTASWLVLPFSNKQWIWKAPITLLHLSPPWWVSLFWSGTLALQSRSQLGLQVCHPVILQCLLAANAAFAVLYFMWGNNPPKIAPSHGVTPNLTCGFLGPPMSSSQTACCLVCHFSAAHHTHTHTRLTALCPGLPRWAGTRKVKSIWILLKLEIVSGSGISWAICKSAPHSRQITTPAPHYSVFLQAGCPSCHPTNSVKALKAILQLTRDSIMKQDMSSQDCPFP